MAKAESLEGDTSPTGLLYVLIDTVKDTVLAPYRVLTSNFAVKAYITSILFTLTVLSLLVFAVVAYILFYWTYIPRIGFSRQIHLQFDTLPAECAATIYHTQASTIPPNPNCAPAHPWGTADLTPDLVSQQVYDITLILSLPRTPTNTAQGNFMLDARLYSPSEKGLAPNSASSIDTVKSGLHLPSSNSENDPSNRLLAHARRPATMTYYSPPIALAHNLASLHWYILGMAREAETLSVPLFENLSFEKGWRNVAQSMKIELQTPDRALLQVYDARVEFRARFRGLRWVMYNWKITSAVVFIGAFWGVEVVATLVVWVVLSWIVFGGEDTTPYEGEDDRGRKRRIKNEDDDGEGDGYAMERKMSDTERSFPTYGSQPPLRYQSSNPSIKREDGTTPLTAEVLAQVPSAGLAIDADDEDEDADFVLDEASMQWRDSGLGTSMESSGPGRGDAVRRRKSRPTSADFI